MTNLRLKSSTKLCNAAVQCLTVAKLANVEVEHRISEDLSRVILEVSGQGNDVVEIVGSTAICFFLSKESNLLDQAKLLQWTNFAASELSCFSRDSKHLARSLSMLEQVLQSNKFIRGEHMTPTDLVLACPLLNMNPPLAHFPHLSSWLLKVQDQVLALTGQTFKTANISPNDHRKTKVKENKAAAAPAKKNKSVAAPTKRKLRLLCLHGYDQSGQAFRVKLGSFRKLVNKQAEFEFMTAPHSVPGVEGGEGQFGWWGSFDTPEEQVLHQLEESIKVVEEAVKTAQQPYDGLLCFSQGASLGAHILMLQQTGRLDLNFKFSILVGGYFSGKVSHRSLFSSMLEGGEKISTPSLHVFGKTDRVILAERSEELLQYFTSPMVEKHTGGHFVPASGDSKKCFTEFLAEMQQRIC